MPLTPEQIADGWIEHDGGECPIDPWQAVTVRLRKGVEVKHPDSRRLDWNDTPQDDLRHSSDIIAYKPENHHD